MNEKLILETTYNWNPDALITEGLAIDIKKNLGNIKNAFKSKNPKKLKSVLTSMVPKSLQNEKSLESTMNKAKSEIQKKYHDEVKSLQNNKKITNKNMIKPLAAMSAISGKSFASYADTGSGAGLGELATAFAFTLGITVFVSAGLMSGLSSTAIIILIIATTLITMMAT